MIRIKIADTRNPVYVNIAAKVILNGTQELNVPDANITKKLIKDIKNGILKLVSGTIPREFQGDFQSSASTNVIEEIIQGADGLETVFAINSYVQKVTPLEKISVLADLDDNGIDFESPVEIIPSGTPSSTQVKIDLSSFPGSLTFGTAPVDQSLIFVLYTEDIKTDEERLDRLERIGQFYEPFIL